MCDKNHVKQGVRSIHFTTYQILSGTLQETDWGLYGEYQEIVSETFGVLGKISSLSYGERTSSFQ